MEVAVVVVEEVEKAAVEAEEDQEAHQWHRHFHQML
jgi:hypothetical protein